jgi:hypothetical protein
MSDHDNGHPHPLMEAIGRGVPVTLLVDLIDPNGPRSAEMFEREGIDPAQVTRWLGRSGSARSA